MLVKVHFLNWDGIAEENAELTDKSFKIYMNSLVGKQDMFEKECYRSRQVEIGITVNEIQDPESFLELVFHELNKDARPNGSYERSMCAGDVIEFENKYFIVLGLGFSEIQHSLDEPIVSPKICRACSCGLNDENVSRVQVECFENGRKSTTEITVCEDCHDEYITGEIDLFFDDCGMFRNWHKDKPLLSDSIYSL